MQSLSMKIYIGSRQDVWATRPRRDVRGVVVRGRKFEVMFEVMEVRIHSRDAPHLGGDLAQNILLDTSADNWPDAYSPSPFLWAKGQRRA